MTPGDVDDNRFVRLIVTTVAAKSRSSSRQWWPARLGIILRIWRQRAREKEGGRGEARASLSVATRRQLRRPRFLTPGQLPNLKGIALRPLSRYRANIFAV